MERITKKDVEKLAERVAELYDLSFNEYSEKKDGLNLKTRNRRIYGQYRYRLSLTEKGTTGRWTFPSDSYKTARGMYEFLSGLLYCKEGELKKRIASLNE